MTAPIPVFKKFSPGKLLLTGEYLVLHGARALATPVKFGQSMEVLPDTHSRNLRWEAGIQGNIWFTADFSLPELKLRQSTDSDKSNFLQKTLFFAQKINPAFLTGNQGFIVKTELDYPQYWGFGSSSSFINNLAAWANIDPMELNNALTMGSGYDIACVQANSAVLFERTTVGHIVNRIQYQPPFRKDICFLYQGVKQNTGDSVKTFIKDYKYLKEDTDFISRLTDQFRNAMEKEEAMQCVEQHENFMGQILGKAPLKQLHFPDFPGAIKSLGAWGGDFAMIISNLDYIRTKEYFQIKGFNTLFKFEELIVNNFTD